MKKEKDSSIKEKEKNRTSHNADFVKKKKKKKKN